MWEVPLSERATITPFCSPLGSNRLPPIRASLLSAWSTPWEVRRRQLGARGTITRRGGLMEVECKRFLFFRVEVEGKQFLFFRVEVEGRVAMEQARSRRPCLTAWSLRPRGSGEHSSQQVCPPRWTWQVGGWRETRLTST